MHRARAFAGGGNNFGTALAIMLATAAVAFWIQSPTSVKRTSWRLTTPASGNELHVAVQVGGCDEFGGFAVRESPQAVVVTAYVREGARTTCPLVIQYQQQTVRLNSPVGARALQGCNPPSAIYGAWPGLRDSDCAAVIWPRLAGLGRVGTRGARSVR